MGISREDILFHLLKDKVVLCSEKIKKKYGDYINVTNLRARIVNYQIEKYGSQLDNKINHIDNKKAWQQSKDRKYYRLYKAR